MLNFKEKIKEEVFMSTPHNQANKGDIAKTVLMPGDPLRAKYLAETYLENVKQFNATRSMFGYTGTYKGKEVSIMGSGMGMPSIGIYSYELFHFYDVENIIRIGSCGSFKEDVHLRDIIIVQGACTDSNYAHQYELPGTYSAISDYSLLEKAVEKAKEKNLTYHVGMSYLLICSIMQTIKQINGSKWDALLQKWNLMLYLQMQLTLVKKH